MAKTKARVKAPKSVKKGEAFQVKTLISHKMETGLRKNKKTGEVGLMCRNISIENGLMIRAVRDGMIMSPSLTFSKYEIDEMIRKLNDSMNEVYEKI